MTDIEKKAYNRQHYLKNRERLLEKAKKRAKAKQLTFADVISLGSRVEKYEKKSNQEHRTRKASESVVLSFLISTITYFLIRETAAFYFSCGDTPGLGYLKAFILEGVVLTLSWLQARTAWVGFVYKAMTLTIYGYSIWAVSAPAVHSSINAQRDFDRIKAQLREVQKEISSDEVLREKCLGMGRITMAKFYESQLIKSREQLRDLRDRLGDRQDPAVFWNLTVGNIVFRILIMFSNYILTRELSTRFGVRDRANFK